MPVQYLDWDHCYDFHKLNELIIPEATAHPARFPWGLINRIIDFCLEKGYIKPGEIVGDCFAGVGLGGIACAYKGIRWCGVELEKRFADWAKQNFAKHAAVWDKFGLPHPIIVQGDSRSFASIVKEALAAAITSPPFTDESNQPRIGQGTREQLAEAGKLPRALNQTSEGNIANLPADSAGLSAVVTSPVYADENTVHLGLSGDVAGVKRKQEGTCDSDEHGYGRSKGQIADCPEGQVSAVLSSPLFQSSQGTTDAEFLATQRIDGCPRSATGIKHLTGEMAESDGNLASMKEGAIDLAITSPAYGDSLERPGGGRLEDGFGVGRSTPGKSCGPHSNLAQSSYGTSEGQVSGMPEGSVADAIISSPVYGGISPEKSSDGIDLTKQYETYRSQGGGMSLEAFIAQQKKHSEGYGKTEGQIANSSEGDVQAVLCSPAYPSDALGHSGGEGPRTTDAPHSKPGTDSPQSYGESAENLGNLEEGEASAVISSPPYATITTGCGGLNTKPGIDGQQSGRSPDAYSQQSGGVYSEDEANLANAPEDGEIQAVLSSPPFVNTDEACLEEGRKSFGGPGGKARVKSDYVHGTSPGQISRLPEMSEEVKNTYWGACRLVYEQVWHALKSGGEPVPDGDGIEFCEEIWEDWPDSHPIEIKNVLYLGCPKCHKPIHGTGESMPGVVALVVKDFVRAGQRIELCSNTARLLEAIGFEMLYRIRSWLVEKTDHGAGWLGPMVTVKKRNSFFRKIHEDGIRDANWWKTLTSDVQAVYLGKAAEQAKQDHATAVAKWEGTDKKKPRPKEPTESKVRKLAAALAYDELCDLPDEELNDDRILEFEEILVARKQA